MNRRARAYTYLALTMIALVFSLWAIGRAWDYTMDTYNSPYPPALTHTAEESAD